jgi:hypothetical protein
MASRRNTARHLLAAPLAALFAALLVGCGGEASGPHDAGGADGAATADVDAPGADAAGPAADAPGADAAGPAADAAAADGGASDGGGTDGGAPDGGAPCPGLTGDFDGDGLVDCAELLPGTGTQASVVLYKGLAAGGYAMKGLVTANVASSTTELVAAFDLDRDGRADLIASTVTASATSTSSLVSLLRGRADGTFGRADTSVDGALHGPDMGFAADFNGDGRNDLLYTLYGASATLGAPYSPRWLVLSAPDPSAFTSAVTNVAVPSNKAYVIPLLAWSLTPSGSLDVIAEVIPGDTTMPHFLAVAINDGQGLLETSAVAGTAGYTSYAVKDFDGDGKLDLSVVIGGQTILLRGDGAGHFAAPPADGGA